MDHNPNLPDGYSQAPMGATTSTTPNLDVLDRELERYEALLSQLRERVHPVRFDSENVDQHNPVEAPTTPAHARAIRLLNLNDQLTSVLGSIRL